MIGAISDFCRNTDQPVPQDEGAFVRCALESVAMRYKLVLGWLEQISEHPIRTVHIVGGGSQNQLLNQMAADATGRQVTAGPVEATTLGNVSMQLIANGDLGSISEAREVIRSSFPVSYFKPTETERWDERLESATSST
jgi:rhamnulokinase